MSLRRMLANGKKNVAIWSLIHPASNHLTHTLHQQHDKLSAATMPAALAMSHFNTTTALLYSFSHSPSPAISHRIVVGCARCCLTTALAGMARSPSSYQQHWTLTCNSQPLPHLHLPSRICLERTTFKLQIRAFLFSTHDLPPLLSSSS